MNDEQRREVAEQVTLIIQGFEDAHSSDIALLERRDKAHLVKIAYLEQTIEVLQASNERLTAAARALYAALHEREHCEVCEGKGVVVMFDDLIGPCSCRITAERALDNWEEIARGEAQHATD